MNRTAHSHLLPDRRHCAAGVEDRLLLRRVAEEQVDEQGVALRVDVLHGQLDDVEGLGLGDLDLRGERREVHEPGVA